MDPADIVHEQDEEAGWTTTQYLAVAITGAALVGGAIAVQKFITPPAGEPQPKQVTVRRPAERKGESEVHRSILCPDGKLVKSCGKHETLWEIYENAVKQYPDSPFLGFRRNNGPYEWETYRQADKRVRAIGSGFMKLGFKPKSLVGIYSRNKPQWLLVQEACNGYSLTIVPLYDTLGVAAVNFILNQSELPIIVCTNDKLPTLLPELKNCPSVTHIITIDPITDADKAEISSANASSLTFLSLSDLEKLGRDSPAEIIAPKSSDLACICYTSGTTGNPKGVLLTHSNYASMIGGALLHFTGLFHHSDVHISYLPLAHIFEQVVAQCVLSRGGSIGFYRGNVLELFDDISSLRPTLFPSVPRLLNRVYDKVMNQMNILTGLKRTLFEKAWAAKSEGLKHGQYKHPLWDKLIFGKVAAKLGGRIRFIMSGSAPISPAVMDFLRICFACDVFEGYGQTENTAGASATWKGTTKTGQVGAPIPANDLKLVDVPDMNYFSTDKPYPRGEVCLKGPNIFQGYYKDEEKTREAIDEYGWLHTGDIGLIHEDGTLKIIDRKKNIFKLAQGEYIAPEKLENSYVKSPLVGQIFVHGNSLKASLVAIIVPDAETVAHWGKTNGFDGKSLAELCKQSELKEAIKETLNNCLKKDKLQGFERISDFYLTDEPFSVENDTLTPTFKLKRPQAAAKYQKEISAMYDNLQ